MSILRMSSGLLPDRFRTSLKPHGIPAVARRRRRHCARYEHGRICLTATHLSGRSVGRLRRMREVAIRTDSRRSWHLCKGVSFGGCPGFKGPDPQPVSMSGRQSMFRYAGASRISRVFVTGTLDPDRPGPSTVRISRLTAAANLY